MSHFLREPPADDYDEFLVQAAKAKYLHEVTFKTLRAGVNHGMAGKES